MGKKAKLRPSPEVVRKPLPRCLSGVAHDGEGDHHPLWRLSLLDAEYDGEWHWRVDRSTSAMLVRFLSDMERLTWREIWDQRTHSKRRDSQKHKWIPVTSLVKTAQDRLAELRLDEFEEMFRFRVGNMGRLWGVLSEESPRVFYVIWWDPEHKICP
ncbi:hypothetical protein [Actinomadura sp. CNU-125]|uniref:hypothetical protein n=1 Tax=Actinomadura sp. CNU-125 TaxID=1904961 RepID=UPI001177598B|nr:hypothetical protein [Actinomadura sp. CNU-125]